MGVLNAGAMNRRLTLQQRAAGADTWGQPNGSWTTVATVWAHIKAPRGTDAAKRVAADREASVTTYPARIRYRTGITSDMRALIDEITPAEIAEVVLDMAGREYADLVLVTGGGDGS